MSTVHPIKVVLRLPRPAPALIVHANAIVAAITADPKQFPSPSPAMASINGHITTLVSCETAAKSRTAGAVAARDAALKVVVVDLNGLGGYVEQLCNADPGDAAAIATAAGMYLRKVGARNKAAIAVKQPVSGTVHVIAKAITGGKAYDWQYSVDGGKTWVSVPTTTQANVTIPSMQTNVTTEFRYRAVTKEGVQDWTAPFSSLVL